MPRDSCCLSNGYERHSATLRARAGKGERGGVKGFRKRAGACMLCMPVRQKSRAERRQKARAARPWAWVPAVSFMWPDGGSFGIMRPGSSGGLCINASWISRCLPAPIHFSAKEDSVALRLDIDKRDGTRHLASTPAASSSARASGASHATRLLGCARQCRCADA